MTTRRYRFVQLDVFSNRPLEGNQLAVFPSCEGLTDAEMQSVAREMNFSETTFVQPATDPAALCRVRIFTPGAELPFAGHPSLGTAVALVLEGRVAPDADGGVRVPLQLGIGIVPVDVRVRSDEVPFAWMHQPLPAITPWSGDPARVAAALGLVPTDFDVDSLPIEQGSAGVPILIVPVRSLAAINRARPGQDLPSMLEAAECLGAYLFTLEGLAPDITAHVRHFAPLVGVAEDPATGSAAGPFAAYLFRHGRIVPDADGIAHARLEQGVEMRRPSLLDVQLEGARDAVSAVRVGGHAVKVAEGALFLPATP
jgi:trans-2,3-dihydro-3-hydroxyanthranilate isomerase